MKTKSVHTVYQAKMYGPTGVLIAVYAGKHRVRAPAFRTKRDGGHIVYRDSYAGGGLYLTTTGAVKWPSYKFCDDSWPGLFRATEGAVIELTVEAEFEFDREARAYEDWLIAELRRHYGDLCVNKDCTPLQKQAVT